MKKNDWYDAGDQIKKLVQDAVDSKDFSELSATIANVVNDTVNSVQSAIRENLSHRSASTEKSGRKEEARDVYQYTNRRAAEQIRRNVQERRRRAAQMEEKKAKFRGYASSGDVTHKEQQKDRTHAVKTVKLRVPGEISGQVMKWTGYSIGSMCGFSLAILAIVAYGTGMSIVVPGGILAVCFSAFMAFGNLGSVRVRLANRFRRYRAVLGNRTYCLVEEMAAAIGKSDKFVQKDLKKMIGRGFFKDGYLARQESLLITDGTTYQQYLDTQTEYERRQMERSVGHADKMMQEVLSEKEQQSRQEKQEKHEQQNGHGKSAGHLSPECRELMEEGKKYIRHIHECNEKISGKVISAKLDRLELVITRIFREVEKDPGSVSDMKKMMSYYLPTTSKLLNAYCELDSQPITGQNIENTKKEIEKALDTINTAFENFLDSFYEEKAWDISSDISVLNTMLAQEGLTGTDFGRATGGIKNE